MADGSSIRRGLLTGCTLPAALRARIAPALSKSFERAFEGARHLQDAFKTLDTFKIPRHLQDGKIEAGPGSL
jgi:hypothetical protein